MNDEITDIQANAIMDTIAEKVCHMIGRTLALVGDMSFDELTKHLTPEVNEVTRECFCEICDVLDITKVIYPNTKIGVDK